MHAFSCTIIQHQNSADLSCEQKKQDSILFLWFFSMASEKKTSLSNVGVWAMKVISSVGIIMVNKQRMSGYNFRFGMFELFVFIKFHLNNCLMDTFSRKK